MHGYVARKNPRAPIRQVHPDLTPDGCAAGDDGCGLSCGYSFIKVMLMVSMARLRSDARRSTCSASIESCAVR
jgi:hypothetical protein